MAQQLLAQAKAEGVELVGPNGLLNQLTANVLETALEAEMDEHLGYEKHQFTGRDGGNSRNGRGSKTVLTEIGPVETQVPRDTDASFDPQIVKKRQRRLTGVDEIVALDSIPLGRLLDDLELRAKVEDKLELKWSPEQIAAWLRAEYPHRPSWHVCHETIYQVLYNSGRPKLCRSCPASCGPGARCVDGGAERMSVGFGSPLPLSRSMCVPKWSKNAAGLGVG